MIIFSQGMLLLLFHLLFSKSTVELQGQSFAGLNCFHSNITHLLLFLSGAKVQEVEQMVENHLETLIIKHFDPKKADSIFSAEGEVIGH